MRGLLAIEPLYHQIVKGNKTQTRRSGGLDAINIAPDEWEETGNSMVHTKHGIGLESVDFCNFKRTQQNITCKPRYKVGEVLYLKEPIAIESSHFKIPSEGVYKYDCSEYERTLYKWSNKLFMPASAAKSFIKITGIKCELLLDISDEDCIAEGIDSAGQYRNGKLHTVYGYRDYSIKEVGEQDPYDLYSYSPNDAKASFISLYKFANKIKPSEVIPNIWVWVYTFEYLPDYKLA